MNLVVTVGTYARADGSDGDAKVGFRQLGIATTTPDALVRVDE